MLDWLIQDRDTRVLGRLVRRTITPVCNSCGGPATRPLMYTQVSLADHDSRMFVCDAEACAADRPLMAPGADLPHAGDVRTLEKMIAGTRMMEGG